MIQNMATWKRVRESLRNLSAKRRPVRSLRVENLQPRRMLSASTVEQPLFFTGTGPGQQLVGPWRPDGAGGSRAPEDIDGDGRVAPRDALRVANAINRDLPAEEFIAADVNRDGRIAVDDFDRVIGFLSDSPPLDASGHDLATLADAEAEFDGASSGTSTSDGDTGGVTEGTSGESTSGTEDSSGTESDSNICMRMYLPEGHTCDDSGTGGTEPTDGTTDGSSTGTTDGSSTGTTDGSSTGTTDGSTDGSSMGTTDGSTDGSSTGTTDSGITDGTDETDGGSTDGGSTDGGSTDGGGTDGGGTDGGGTDGGGTGTTDGTATTGATRYFLEDHWFGSSTHGEARVEEIDEGESVGFVGRIDGPRDEGGYLIDPPEVVIDADLDFDGEFDEEERFVYDHVDTSEGWFYLGLRPRDDGPHPGNGTPRDQLNVRVTVQDDVAHNAIEVNNVAPTFQQAPNVRFDYDELGNLVATIPVRGSDPGIHDRHHATVRWGDGETSEAASDCDDGECDAPHEVDVSRTFDVSPDAPAPHIYPVQIELRDDDSGAVSYTIQQLDVAANLDDDDGNDLPDIHDTGFVDDDLTSFFLNALVPEGVDASLSTFELHYDPGAVRLWGTADKTVPLDSRSYQTPPLHNQVWVEGISPGNTQIAVNWRDPTTFRVQGGATVHVTVWGLDLDIDSDNNNVFNYPDNSDWEEYLEDNEYGIGKLVYPSASHYTPMRLRLPPGLDPNVEAARVQFDFAPMGQSGAVKLWNTHEADPNRNPGVTPADEGGNRLYPDGAYSLADLRYDPASGGITVFVEAVMAREAHATKKGAETRKPDDRVNARLVSGLRDVLADEVKYMVTEVDTFYPHLQDNEALRNAMASEGVYAQADLSHFALRRLTPEDLEALGVPDDIVDLIGEPESVPGFKNAVYHDHISGKYVLAFAGTDDIRDVIEDIWQAFGWESEQYPAAMEIATELQQKDHIRGKLITTGHSLGGGLASAASVAAGIPADTFNAAGLLRDTLLARDQNGDVIPGQELHPGSLNNYDNNAPALIDAHYLDWELLSWLQDHTPLQDAIGTRIKMDGPLDFRLAMDAALAGVQIASGAGWPTVVRSLGDAIHAMAQAHTTEYYHYGLMVRETEWGRIEWDIYGYDFY